MSLDDAALSVASTLPWVDGASLSRALPWPHVIDTLESAIRAGAALGDVPPRTGVPLTAGELLLMPAQVGGDVGVKVISVHDGSPGSAVPRIQGVHLAFDGVSLAPVAVLEARTLTLLRTAGLSAVAARHLAPASARSLVVFGTGPQSVAHALAINSVRPLERVSVIGRRPEAVEAVIERLRCSGLAARAGSLADVQVADIVACCTTAADPLFDSRELLPEATVIAVGSHSPTRREVDAALVRSATVIVESRKSALAEAGDIVLAITEGVSPATAIDGDLSQLVRGEVTVPESGPRLFKSVGEAWADVVVASTALREVLAPAPVR